MLIGYIWFGCYTMRNGFMLVLLEENQLFEVVWLGRFLTSARLRISASEVEIWDSCV